MKILKNSQKDIVSGAIVHAPTSFTKPLDYDTTLVSNQHPTLRPIAIVRNVIETDPQYPLYPSLIERVCQESEYYNLFRNPT